MRDKINQGVPVRVHNEECLWIDVVTWPGDPETDSGGYASALVICKNEVRVVDFNKMTLLQSS
jgi:hypothetical protein